MKSIKKFFTIFSVVIAPILILSCKSDAVKPSESTVAPMNSNLDELPVACDLINAKTMAGILGINAADLEVSDGNKSGKGGNTASCSYRWNDKVYDASGILILVEPNPLPDELPDFVQKSLDNKKYEGERSMNQNEPAKKYKDFEGLADGVQAVYNEELDKYVFARDVKYLYTVALNYPVDQEKQNEFFRQIANHIFPPK